MNLCRLNNRGIRVLFRFSRILLVDLQVVLGWMLTGMHGPGEGVIWDLRMYF